MTSIYNAAVKAEPMNGQSPVIKQDPDLIGVSDEDIYEDTGDLDFTAAEQNIFLTRIPKFLYESWSKLDDDQEITVGTIRVEGSPRDVKRVSGATLSGLCLGSVYVPMSDPSAYR